ncbi:hypothetical protein JKA14_23025 [Vibrio parahaemolyticus]|uniref:hypothetical protein n=1 Tax=Vibrio TaxID=662 RepID=UPI00128F0012|nr:hypothetical protein [Vibrio parahaemolyticus]MBO1655209.1 hypothetical protein [Vibrio parahaemolyticus]MDZ5096608.1 hypothetical protein [Vibrio parahaemolyticus]
MLADIPKQFKALVRIAAKNSSQGKRKSGASSVFIEKARNLHDLIKGHEYQL